MLNLYFGYKESNNYATKHYFDYAVEPNWFHNQFIIDMVEDIDKNIMKIEKDNNGVITSANIYSPAYESTIAPQQLSNGLKLCILMCYHPELDFYGTACGNNCAKWILKIADTRDLNLSFEHIMRFPEPFQIKIANDGTIVTNMSDLIIESLKWLEV